MRSYGWALSQCDRRSYQKRKCRHGHVHVQKKGRVRTQGEGGNLQARDRGLGEPILILDL